MIDFIKEILLNYWELVYLFLPILGFIAYRVATHNRGSFVDTPVWSKLIRRTIELACVYVGCFLFLLRCDSLLTILLFVSFIILTNVIMIYVIRRGKALKDKASKEDSHSNDPDLETDKQGSETYKQGLETENLGEHLINAIVLVLFLISVLVIFLIFFFKITESDISICLFVFLGIIFAIESAILLYQILSIFNSKNTKNNENLQIIQICKELNN
ncbi:hypothetical protein Hs30E_09340 [Lactococcus hodotermopsidis]|uniref:Uncharacterized protein n=1 Tax=Pseudolactococcus hodotermopsidis TaxID=2709157 RepID=A0A6A0BCE9_9LACT|nr:hypothetical protein [Lactococcus hodotermopsidis]GFH42383.1 hypothetical protein Hs30E_09340 [Lactococcus hodotermopsidis]